MTSDYHNFPFDAREVENNGEILKYHKHFKEYEAYNSWQYAKAFLSTLYVSIYIW